MALETTEFFDHESGFRATLPLERGQLAALKSWKVGRHDSSALDFLIMFAVLIPLPFVSGWVPEEWKVGLYLTMFGMLVLVQILTNRLIETDPVRIIDLDRGHVRVAKGDKVIFSAPIEHVEISTPGLSFRAGGEVLHLNPQGPVRGIIERLEQAKHRHGSRADVPQEMSALRQSDHSAT